MGALEFIYKNLDQFKRKFVVVFIAGILDGFAVFFVPVLLAQFTQHELNFRNFQNLISSILVLYVLSLGLQWVIRRYGEALSLQFGNHIRLKYFRVLERMPMKDLADHHSGYILSLINKVSDGFTPILFDIFWVFSKSISNLILFFYFTAQESFAVAVINLIVLIFFVSMSMVLSKKIVSIAGELNRRRALLMESYADFVSNIFTIKRLGIYSFARGRLLRRTEENYEQIQKLQDFHANRWCILHAIFGLAYLFTLGFLLLQISRGSASASILILFVAAYSLIIKNVERLSESFKSLMEMKGYIESLDRIVSLKDIDAGSEDPDSWRKINFRNVSFRYEGSGKKIDIPDFCIEKGEKVCIFGKSGEGKTTFMNLFVNFMNPQEGERLVDGCPYERISGDFFQREMTMISQEVELFNLSLRDNIMLGNKIGEEAIWDILDKFDLREWVKSLDDELETVVGEKGIKLSAGQKQRINLMRGILLGREILLLDEPTSHLDAVTEKRAVEFLREYLSGRTAIIISHREEIRKICGRCYAIEDHIMREA